MDNNIDFFRPLSCNHALSLLFSILNHDSYIKSSSFLSFSAKNLHHNLYSCHFLSNFLLSIYRSSPSPTSLSQAFSLEAYTPIRVPLFFSFYQDFPIFADRALPWFLYCLGRETDNVQILIFCTYGRNRSTAYSSIILWELRLVIFYVGVNSNIQIFPAVKYELLSSIILSLF